MSFFNMSDRQPGDAGLWFEIWILTTWLGLVGGMFELGTILALYAYDPRVPADSIRINRHYLWMIPLSDLAIGLVLGLVLASFRKFSPKRTQPIFTILACLMITYPPVSVVDGIHRTAQWLLVAGICLRLGQFISKHPIGTQLLIRRSGPLLLTLFVGLVVLSYYRNTTSESNALPVPNATDIVAPNVLLIVLDNVRADHLSPYGYERDTSPNLRRISQTGFRFQDARSPAPWTLPSHASIMTGRWPNELSVNVDHPLDAAVPTLAEVFTKQGYVTGGFVGNTYYCNGWFGLDRGFVHYEDFPQNRAADAFEILRASKMGRRLTELLGFDVETPDSPTTRKTAATVNRDAVAWLDRHPNRPFFVFLNYYDAHEPFDPPPCAPRQYGLSRLPAMERAAILESSKLLLKNSQSTLKGEQHRLINERAELLSDSYDDCIYNLDRELGNLFDQLETRGKLRNTIVAITSDHGEHFGEHGIFGHGHSLYSPVLNIPLIILDPSRTDRGKVIEHLVSTRDLAFTIADLASIKHAFPGTNLLPQTGSSESSPTPSPAFAYVEHQKAFPPSPAIPASLGPLWSVATSDLT